MYVVRRHGQKGQKAYFVHRFIWECFNGLITDGKVIDHINDIKDDNRLCNLQMMTYQQNSKKSAKKYDLSYIKYNRINPKCVKAVNCDTNDVIYFNSMSCCSNYLNINCGTIKGVCDGEKYRKSGVSEKDGNSYRFEYVNKEDMPDNYLKSANIRPKRLSDEEKKHHFEAVNKWQNK